MAELTETLRAEGAEYRAKYTRGDWPADDFIADVRKRYNRRKVAKSQRTAEQIRASFAVMHGYLGDAYIGGLGDRETAWVRWVDYLTLVDEMTPAGARRFARHLFRAVDDVAPYS